MRRAIIGLLMAAMLAACLNQTGSSRFKDGFRGIAWGTTKSGLPDLGLSKKTLKNIYKKGPSAIYLTEGRTNLEMRFDGTPLLSVFLKFNNMVFYGFDMVFKQEYADRVLADVAKEMRTRGKKTPDGMHWVEDGLVVTVTDRELMVDKAKFVPR